MGPVWKMEERVYELRNDDEGDMRRGWKVLRVERGKLRGFGGNRGGQDGVRRTIWVPK